jgi:hypothetical protein
LFAARGPQGRTPTGERLLKNNRDRVTPPAQVDWVSPEHDNLRGSQNYQ